MLKIKKNVYLVEGYGTNLQKELSNKAQELKHISNIYEDISP